MAPTTYTSVASPAVAMAAPGTTKVAASALMAAGELTSVTSANSGGDKARARKPVSVGSSAKSSRPAGKKSAYKHVPHALKPVHLVAKRNARERRRVQAVNSAFMRLRKHVPYEPRHKRLSKVKTLRVAISYIAHLQDLIREHDRQVAPCHHSQQALHHLAILSDSNIVNPPLSNSNSNTRVNTMVDDFRLVTGRVGGGSANALAGHHGGAHLYPSGHVSQHLLQLQQSDSQRGPSSDHVHNVWVENAQFMAHPSDNSAFKHLAATAEASPCFLSPCQTSSYDATSAGYLPFNGTGYSPQNPCQLIR